MALAGQDHVVTSGVDASAFPRPQQVQQAAPRHIFRNLDTGSLKDGWSYVDQAGKVGDHSSPGDTLWPPHGKRHARPVVVQIRLGTRKRHPVVAGDDDNGVLQLASRFQVREDLAEFPVEALDLEVVVENVAANLRVVRKERRHRHILGAQPAGDTRTLLVGAMRVAATEPKTERSPGRVGFVEGLEVVVPRACGIARAAPGFQAPGRPALAGEADVVPRRFEQVGVRHELGGQGTPQVDALFEAVALLARQDGPPGWSARRRVAEGVFEPDALGGNAVKHRRADNRVAGRTSMGEGLVVRDREQDIRTRPALRS